MPLSDAARRLLAGRAAPGGHAPEPEPAPPKPEPEPSRTGFKERAKAEAERFLLATDTEFWICLCFRRAGDPGKFAKALTLEPDTRGYLRGPDVEHATANVKADLSPAGRMRQMLTARSTRDTDVTGQLSVQPLPDPIASLTPDRDVESASVAELDAIHAALTAPPDPAPANTLDSPHWLLIYWAKRDDKDTWLTRTGLEVLGDKYLDGHQAARILGVHMKGG